jgi:hypothetical protein
MRFDTGGVCVREHVRRDLATVRGKNGYGQRQNQGTESFAGLELLPQALRAAVRTVAKRYSDEVSFGKNYLAVHFQLDHVNAQGDIFNYYPDFIVNKALRNSNHPHSGNCWKASRNTKT